VTKRSSKRASDLLAVTAGEPAGIGPELCLALAGYDWSDRIVIIGDPGMLAERAAALDLHIPIHEYSADRDIRGAGLNVLPVPLANKAVCGSPDPANAQSLLDGLRRGVDGCQSGAFAALVTAPIQKSVINDAGIPFSGHTEFLAQLTGGVLPVMLLASDDLRVALATTHLPLRDVPAALSTDGIADVVRILDGDLRKKFGIENPRILVCGLNPHAGEGGHLGSEDDEIIRPAVERCIAEGIDVHGPLPADTAFTPAAGRRDVVLAMYHDQGLPVVKYAGFGQVVNVTLGLPIIRTSVDHGTALDIAGTGEADSGSMLAAIALADELARV
jgi:4-hydroxythreonine-4-phosphate dehydrogenase